MVLINLGAGFTSYPFLTEWPCACIEVDFERVVNFKRLKTDEWKRKGLLPNRDIEFVACDLSKRIEIAALRSRLERELAGRISAAFLEGITYYLKSAILSDLFALLRDIQTEESLIAFDFWTPCGAPRPQEVQKVLRRSFWTRRDEVQSVRSRASRNTRRLPPRAAHRHRGAGEKILGQEAAPATRGDPSGALRRPRENRRMKEVSL
jgi:O-methyltransferase involved in polyketide biosynthesis